jgi:hypothetical protein
VKSIIFRYVNFVFQVFKSGHGMNPGISLTIKKISIHYELLKRILELLILKIHFSENHVSGSNPARFLHYLYMHALLLFVI